MKGKVFHFVNPIYVIPYSVDSVLKKNAQTHTHAHKLKPFKEELQK